MEISFANRKLAGVFESRKSLIREYGSEDAQRINRRLTQLFDAPDLETMRNLPGRCHELRGDRAGHLAIDVNRNYRLIFRPTDQPPPSKDDGGLYWAEVKAITILEVADYHGD